MTSENGWYLSPHGTIRVLVLFAEIEYDRSPARDPQPDGAEHWPKGQLPRWKDDVFDPFPSERPKAMATRYYHEMSLGRYTVLGDYIDTILTLKESEHPSIGNAHSIGALAVKEANKMGSLRTHGTLSIPDFDLWKRGGKPGLPKQIGADDPHSYDHVMVIVRNSGLTHGQGSTDPGSPGKLFGFESDSQSRFGGMGGLPFEILKHEFNHLLFGGNNFHSGGGNAPIFNSHFINLQGGWSMMGAANSALLTANGWDRDRLGWRAMDACARINARDLNGRCISGDLDPMAGDTGTFVLRDFITSGDALRIRAPYLPEDEFPQWIWLENHQTERRNGSPTDRFHYESFGPCVKPAVPGIYAMMQVGRNEKQGSAIYGGEPDHLRPILASGFHDIVAVHDTAYNQCLWTGPSTLYRRDREGRNPLTGFMDQELICFDRNKDGQLRKNEHFVPRMELVDGVLHDEAVFFGHSRHAFTVEGNNLIGLGTNPGSANMITLVSGSRDLYKGGKPNNRVVHLNSLSIRLLEQRTDGGIVLRIRNDDVCVQGDVRWCADSIVLHASPVADRPSLLLTSCSSITIDRSGSPSRISDPEVYKGIAYFNKATRMSVLPGARIELQGSAALNLRNGSELHLLPGSVLQLDPSSTVSVDGDSRIIVHGDARMIAAEKQMARLERKGRAVRVP